MPDRAKLNIYSGDTFQRYFRFTEDGGRVVYDGVTTSGDATVSSVKAKFVPGDVGKTFYSPGFVSAGTLIQSVAADGSYATLNAAAGDDATGGATFIIRSTDISAYEFAAQIRKNARSAIVLATLTCDVSGADGGELLLKLDADTTAGLRSTGSWDLQTTLNGVTTTWIRGSVHVDADTTRV